MSIEVNVMVNHAGAVGNRIAEIIEDIASVLHQYSVEEGDKISNADDDGGKENKPNTDMREEEDKAIGSSEKREEEVGSHVLRVEGV